MGELAYRHMRSVLATAPEMDAIVARLYADGWELLPDYCSPIGDQVRLIFGNNHDLSGT